MLRLRSDNSYMLRNIASTTENEMKRNILLAGSLIALAAITRFLPHPPNFTAVGAMALFGGAYLFNKKLWWVLPIAIMLLSDTILELTTGWGFHGSIAFVYGAFVLTAFIGKKFLSKNRNPLRIVLASIAGSAIFFILSNFGAFLASGLYPPTFAGLISAYAAAIPFYNQDPFSSFALNTLLSDLTFNTLLFSLMAVLESKTYKSLEISK